MKKKITAIVLALVMLCSVPVSAATVYEPADVKITLDGLLQKTEVQPVKVDGYVMASLSEMVKLLNGTTEWSDSTKTVKAKIRGVVAEFKVGSKDAVVNYTDVVMPVAPVIVNGYIMVPLQFISEKFNLRIDWSEEKRLVSLSSGKQKYSVIEARPEVKTVGAVEFTFKKAVDTMNESNSTIRGFKDTSVILLRNQTEINEYIDDNIVPLYNGFKNIYTQTEVNYFRQQRQIRDQFDAMALNTNIIKEGNALQLNNALCDIAKTDLDIYLLEEKIKMNETNLANMRLKFSLGMETQTNITSLENTIAKDKISLNNLVIKQKDNNLSLNKLVGADASKTVKITDFNYNDFSYNNDVDAHVKEQLKNAPTVVLKEIDVLYAEYERFTYKEYLLEELQSKKNDKNEDPLNEIEMENKILSARRALDDTKKTLEQKIRTTHNSIKQLEQSYESLKVDYETAKANYENGVMNYVAGYATVFDVQQLQLGLLNAEVAFITNRISMKTLVESYNHPYL